MSNNTFIDLMGDAVWSDADIAKRTDAMTTSAFPDRQTLERDELFKQGGHGPPATDPTAPNENARFGQYVSHSNQMRQLFKDAVADMALLKEAMAVEDAYEALENIPPEDEEARAPYIEIIENASQEARDLAALRMAEHEPEPPREPGPKAEEQP